MKTLHLVALPHTQVSSKFCGCAYTAKVLKFCKMMGRSYKIFLYAPAGPPVPGATLVPCLSIKDRLKIFGADDPKRLPLWPKPEQSQKFNIAALTAISDRAKAQELVLLTAGATHEPIMHAVKHYLLCCEPFCGYEGIITGNVAFESFAHRHTVYAKRGMDGRNFDDVIPNFFDPAEFTLNKGRGKYLLFLGRLIQRKGLATAAEIAKACGLPLKVAGAGATSFEKGKIVAPEVTIEGDVHYEGVVDVAKRARLLAGARAVLVPTSYVEPFGGVAVEAMMSGTPAITSDWGAFAETVENGVSGFRVRTMREAINAVQKCDSINPLVIRKWAHKNYSFDAVRPKFVRWFDQLETLWGKGWYT